MSDLGVTRKCTLGSGQRSAVMPGGGYNGRNVTIVVN